MIDLDITCNRPLKSEWINSMNYFYDVPTGYVKRQILGELIHHRSTMITDITGECLRQRMERQCMRYSND